MMEVVFWAALGIILYTYFGYPAVLWAWCRLRRRAAQPGAPAGENWSGRKRALPRIAVVIAAHNEAGVIRDKLRSVLALDYPRHRLSVIVVSDGSTDGTEDAVRSVGQGVRLIVARERQGKAEALNRAVRAAECDILLMTDARQRLHPYAARALAQHFDDPRVGAVSGRLVLESDGGRELREIGLYWRYELWLRRREARIGSLLGTTGAIYAVRRRLWRPIPPDTILDDVFVPMALVLAGWRVTFEADAIAYDRCSASLEREFGRKVRTLAGNFQVLALLPQILNPLRNPVWFQYASHKLARLVVPFALVALLAANLGLREGWYGAFLWLQIGGYGLALIGGVAPLRRVVDAVLNAAATIAAMNLAAVLGLVYYARGKRDLWTTKPPAAETGAERRAS